MNILPNFVSVKALVGMEMKTDIRKYDLEALQAWFLEAGEAKFRAKQVYEWLWKKSAHSFGEMTNLSKVLREKLDQHFAIYAPTIDLSQNSFDGTIKTRFKLHDGHLIESVLIPVPDDRRFTACVSSQVGCSLTCSFCATGRMARKRNLEPGEIYDQVVAVNRQSEEQFGHPLTNIVYMGMGEPLLAYKNVLESIDKITSPQGLGMSPKRITVSTAGIAKMIRKLADDQVKFNLALSLHAADDVKRNEIMPINEQNNLAILMDALEYFHRQTRNRITYEYIAFQRFNDSLEDAANLAKLCSRFPVRINIIEYNPIDGAPFVKSDQARVDAFAKYLTNKDISVTIRRSRGKDIDAACGQLANK
ncbi:MAG: 23S rRNA (adenine(2503)-C(2))-methyltransferase RlmN [Bacteroidota bacterium]